MNKTRNLLIWSFVLALVGLVLSVLSLNEHAMMFIGKQLGLDPQSSFCNISAEMNCKAVNESSWSVLFGIPIAAYGVWFYAVLIGFLVMLSDQDRFYEDEAFEVVSLFSFLGLIASGALFYISKFKVGVLCPLCLGVYLVNILLVALAFVCRTKKGYLSGVKDGFWGLISFLLESLSLNGKSRAPALRMLGLVILLSGIVSFTLRHTLSIRYIEKFSAEPDWSKESIAKLSVNTTPGVSQDYSKGPEDAPLKLVEFADYECPACQVVSLALSELYNNYSGKVQFVFKNYPLDASCNPNIKKSFHENACYAAFLSRCAGLQNKFWEMNEYLFGLGARSEGLDAAALRQRMTDGINELGLDSKQIDLCMKDPSLKEKILSDIKDGDAAGLEGTPFIFINGKRVRDISYDSLANIFEDILGPLPK